MQINEHLREIARSLSGSTDHFGRLYTNELTDLIDVPGEHDFTPERLRYYKDGSRRFLEYGSDANYSETATGHLLEPDAGQTLRLELAERTAYPVGFDLLPSLSRRITQAPQAGDVVMGGYGRPDVANFDPAAESYSAGSNADGYLWAHTADTGLSEVLLLLASDGSIVDSERVSLQRSADAFSILEQRLNWYAVGPALFRETFTDSSRDPEDVQQNRVLGVIANDGGKAASDGSHHVAIAIHQASGNTGLGVEAGSMAIKSTGMPAYQFKIKGHSMDLENTSTTQGEYQVLAAIRQDPDRPSVKLRIPQLEIISTPGDGVTWSRLLIISVDPSETNVDATGATWSTPPEHNPANSVVEEIEVAGDATTPLVGPVEDDANTDASGPATANTMTNPGGYQLGRESVTPEGTGATTTVRSGQQVGRRNLYDGDIALLLADCATAGTLEVDLQTEQNS